MAVLSILMLVAGGGVAQAKGGAAKPPTPKTPPPFTAIGFPPLVAPTFTGNIADLHQFDVTGFIQTATVDPAVGTHCTKGAAGGSVKVNNLTIVVPCNLIVQMPANTLTWEGFINSPIPKLPTTLMDAVTGSPTPGTFPSFEVHVVGNAVDGRNIAGLIYVSQQSLNAGQGIISKIDYATGNIEVAPRVGAPTQAVVQINDPNGRYGRAQSPDARFSVDDANPTIKAATGYPMCVPRTATDPTVAGNPDDPLCPQHNRPTPGPAVHCRTWTDAGLNPLPVNGDLPQPFPGQVYCGHYVMPALPAGAATTTGPDARQQVPFEVGDYINFAGTLVHGATGAPDFISAHTIDDQVAPYTQPRTQPSYVAIESVSVGSADPIATFNGIPQETQDRMVLVADTTDVATPVDAYLTDVDPTTGTVNSRWVTQFAMTGETSGPNLTSGAPVGGGITTQFQAAQQQRARLRASKAPTGLLTSPTRNLQVMQRTLCLPTPPATDPYPVATTATTPVINAATTDNTGKPATCAARQNVANGLLVGQYTAPVFNFIFPENAKKGDPVIPNDLWDLGFLGNGEGSGAPPTNPLAVGPLSPTPW